MKELESKLQLNREEVIAGNILETFLDRFQDRLGDLSMKNNDNKKIEKILDGITDLNQKVHTSLLFIHSDIYILLHATLGCEIYVESFYWCFSL